MNKNRIENPNSNNELDCLSTCRLQSKKSSSTIRTNPARRRYIKLIIMSLMLFCSCKSNYNLTTNKEEDVFYTKTQTLVEGKFKIINKTIVDSIDDGYGVMYGYVTIRNSGGKTDDGDTIQGIEARFFNTKLHVLENCITVNIDGPFYLKLPIGKYKICIEGLYYPIVNEIEIRNKESILINYYLGAKYLGSPVEVNKFNDKDKSSTTEVDLHSTSSLL